MSPTFTSNHVTRVALVAALGLTGCFDYAGELLQASSLNDAATNDAAADMSSMCTISTGKFLTLTAYSRDSGLTTAGPTISYDGVNDPMYTSMPADALGHLKLAIPQCIFGVGRFLIIDGAVAGTPIVRTWMAPAKYGKAELDDFIHFYESNTDPAKGVQNNLAKELVAAGLITAVTDFKTNYSWAMGRLIENSGGATAGFAFYKIQIVDNGTALDNTSCNPKAQCCVYYLAGEYGDFINGRVGPNYIKFSDTIANGGWYATVCPTVGTAGTNIGNITLKQIAPTSTLKDSNGQSPDFDFPSIDIPRPVGNGVTPEWRIVL